MDLPLWQSTLQRAGVNFAPGLTESELRRAEESYGLIFPPDLRMLLTFALPVGKSWPNWRDIDSPEIEKMLNWPYEGMCFDIKNNAFWPKQWGPKPVGLRDCFILAKQRLNDAPKLIPILGHRYLPERPGIEGNPVLSVYQTDIVHYGTDLWNYFQNEFYYYFGTPEYQITEPIRRIEFWSDIIDGDC
jgi:hypothetical protein